MSIPPHIQFLLEFIKVITRYSSLSISDRQRVDSIVTKSVAVDTNTGSFVLINDDLSYILKDYIVLTRKDFEDASLSRYQDADTLTTNDVEQHMDIKLSSQEESGRVRKYNDAKINTYTQDSKADQVNDSEQDLVSQLNTLTIGDSNNNLKPSTDSPLTIGFKTHEILKNITLKYNQKIRSSKKKEVTDFSVDAWNKLFSKTTFPDSTVMYHAACLSLFLYSNKPKNMIPELELFLLWPTRQPGFKIIPDVITFTTIIEFKTGESFSIEQFVKYCALAAGNVLRPSYPSEKDAPYISKKRQLFYVFSSSPERGTRSCSFLQLDVGTVTQNEDEVNLGISVTYCTIDEMAKVIKSKEFTNTLDILITKNNFYLMTKNNIMQTRGDDNSKYSFLSDLIRFLST